MCIDPAVDEPAAPPCFVLSADDKLAVAMLREYRDRHAYSPGSTPDSIAKLDALIAQFHQYERQHPDQIKFKNI